MIKFRLDSEKRVRIKPKGRSMLPFLKEKRDEVIISVPEKPIKKYDIVLYKHDGVYVLHRVIKIKDKFFFICGDNSAVLEAVEREQILGVVTRIIKSGKKINPDGKLLKLRVCLWYKFGVKRIVMRVKKLMRKKKRML